MKKTLRILGTRGIPAEHGGFETFAENLAIYLASRKWNVIVYCQVDGSGNIHSSNWQGINLVNIPIKQKGALGTIIFDWKSILHAVKTKDIVLTLGYNTAIFCVLFRLCGVINLINMDGIEWRRDKWSLFERIWLYFNERAGCLLGNHLIADHPEIKNHLITRVNKSKITTIPYGSDSITNADEKCLERFNIEPGNYAIVIARPEPENSILEIVTAFSRKKRNKKLVVLGNFEKANKDYSQSVFDAASAEVIFPGAVYDKDVINALRYFACLYIHGHTVGGTNPSLVEALGAGNPILAHDNKFNRWVAGDESEYFSSIDSCELHFDELFQNDARLLTMRNFSYKTHNKKFRWDSVLPEYEKLLIRRP